MKKYTFITAVLLFVYFSSGFISTLYADNRETIEFNESWKFYKGNPADAHLKDYVDTNWETIQLPHTWNNLDGQDGGDNYYRGIGWYRKNTIFIAEDSTKKIYIRFGSANLQSTLYLNGTLIGDHIGGYSAFIFDITDAIIWGEENVFAVKVSNQTSIDAPPLSADFTFFGGITRNVTLIKTNRLHISPLDYASSGVYLSATDVSASSANLKITVLVKNDNETTSNTTIIATVSDSDDNVVQQLSSTELIPAGTRQDMVLATTLTNPHLWNGRMDPYLYNVTVKVMEEGIELDQINQNIGFRYYHVDPDSGFYLNGHRYPLHGVAMHEDRPDKGRAISNADRKQDMELMHEMGCNFLRLAHYQHGQFTYNYCDSSGMILWTEVPIINNVSESETFTTSAKTQLTELIKQNYNHPSVFFWGLFNEINYLSGPEPAPLIQELHDLACSLDSTRLTTAAAMNSEEETNWIPDLISWNKYLGWYGGSYNDFGAFCDWLHDLHPDTKIGISEYGVGASINHHQENPAQPATDGPWHPEEYQNLFHEVYWQAIQERPYIWSSAIWVGFDFASDWRSEGDALGINDKGMVTRDRKVKKDAYHYYKANWTDEPMVYISSRRFTERFDSPVEVKVYSNCDSVHLQVNETSYQGVISDNHIFKWINIPLKEGENNIEAFTYVDDKLIKDLCIWNYTKVGNDTIVPGDIQINFQTSNTTTPDGYLADVGLKYGNRGNGLSYGWDIDNTANARQRSSSSDMLFNTFNHMQKNDANRTWEIALDNGDYVVSIGSGDPDYTDSYHAIEAEDQLILIGSHTADQMIKSTDTVKVEDGRLTIKPSEISSNAKLNFVHISSQVLGIENGPELPLKTTLYANFPNPFNLTTTINYQLKTKSEVQLKIYDITGREIKTLVNQRQTAGEHSIIFNASDLASGIYIYRLKAGSFEQSRKMLLLK